MPKYFGPFLKLNMQHQPESWFVYVLSDDQTLTFYSKRLDSGTCYQSFEFTEPFYALSTDTDSLQKFMFIKHNDEYYQAIYGQFNVQFINILTREQKNALRKQIKTNLEFEIPSLSQDLIVYGQTSEQGIQTELSPTEVKHQTYSYPIEILVQNLDLTPTQRVVVDNVSTTWNLMFKKPMTRDEVQFACKKLLGYAVEEKYSNELDGQAHIFRQSFFIPSSIGKCFNDEIIISDVCNFLSQLVLTVYQKTFPDEENLKYSPPQVANQTVKQYKEHSQRPDGEFFIDDEAFANALQLFEYAVSSEIQNPDVIATNAEILNDFRVTLKDELFPRLVNDLNLFQKVCEWICNWCAIMDICCLQLSQTARKYQEYILRDPRDNSFFGNNKTYEENIYNEFVTALIKGR